MEPITTAAAIIAGAKTAKELLDSFKDVCASVKGAAEGGQDLADAGAMIGSIFTAEDRVTELHKQATAKGNKQEVIALVQAKAHIREEKRKLRTVLAWSCPAGMYQDWQALEEANAPTVEEKRKVRKKIQRDDDVKSVIIGFTIAAAITVVICAGLVLGGVI